MSLADVLRDHKIAFHETGKNTRRGWINLRCPFCHKDPYLGINLNGKYGHCWNCGSHDLWKILRSLTGMMGWQIAQILEGMPTTHLRQDLIATGKLAVPYDVSPMSEYHREYLTDRRFSASYIAKVWGVQGIGQFGAHLRWRLYIPVNLHGVTVSWTTRTIVDKREPRYWSAKDEESAIPIDRLLYGIDYARAAVVVVEGPTDAWAIGPGAVATLGTKTSAAQLEQLSTFPVRVVCFDSEEAAQRRARKLANDLSVFAGITHNIQLDSGKDPATATKEEIEQVRHEFLTPKW